MRRWFFSSWLYGAVVLAFAALYYRLPRGNAGFGEGGWTWFRHRLAQPEPLPVAGGAVVWLHGVSAGEVKVAVRLAGALKAADPSLRCVVSTATATGYAMLGEAPGVDRVAIMPPDVPRLVARLAQALRPDVAVLCESDFWPGTFAVLRQAGVPVVIANARMSARSVRRFRAFPFVARATLGGARAIVAQDDVMAARFAASLPRGTVVPVSGNLKLAAPVAVPAAAVRRNAITFASLHEAELPMLAGPIRALAAALPDHRLFVVPRHPGMAFERHLAALLPGAFQAAPGDDGSAGPGVYLVARLGVLPALYAQSAVAVVGGSFTPIGGHDVAEPLHHGALALTGPHMFRQTSLVATLARAGVLATTTPEQLVDAVLALLSDDAGRTARLAAFARLSREATDGVALTVATIRATLAAERSGRPVAPVAVADVP